MSVSPTTSDARNSEDILNISEEDPSDALKEKLKLFFQVYWRGLVCLLTPIILIAILAPFPPAKYQWCAYTLIVMAVYWVTECIPLAITSFLPILVFPLTGVMDTNKTCSCYVNDTITMFLGSLMLAYAVEQSGLHKRLALCTIRTIGYSHYRLLFAMSYTTMFVSMWITNTAATTMMVPISFAILKVFEDQNLLKIYDTDINGYMTASDITTCYFCSVTFSATVGGVGTLVGTATNLVFKGLFSRTYPEAPEYLSFPNFSAFTIPYMLVVETAVFIYMLVVYIGFLRPNSNAAKKASISEKGILAAKSAVSEQWNQLGKITFWEVMVIILFSGAMILFFCRSPQIFQGWGDDITKYYNITEKKFVKDSAAAVIVCCALMLLPANLGVFKNFKAKIYGDLPDKPIRALLDWTEMNGAMPFGFMFLLGGGFALSEAAKKEYSDLNGKIGDMLKNLHGLPNYFIIFFIIVFTVFVTNFAANVAVCNVIVPIVMQMAKEMKMNPLWYNIAAGLSASFCFCLPVGTPGNLIVQGAANIPTSKMASYGVGSVIFCTVVLWIKAGVGPTLSTILLTWISVCFWAPVIWPDLTKQLDWMFV